MASADVLFVTKPLAPPWDDSGKVLPYLVARHLKGVRVAVMTARGAPVALPGVASEEVYPARSSFQVPAGDKVRLLFRLLARATPPVVHFFFTPNGPTTRAARLFRRLRPRVRVVQTVMSLPADPEILATGIFADRVVCWSRFAAERVQAVIDARGLEARVVHVPPGVEEARPLGPAERRQARIDLGLPPDRPVVLYAGDLEFGTAARVTAEALPRVLERVPAVFVFASRPKTPAAIAASQALQDLLVEPISRGHARFPGAVKSFGDLLRCVDLQVLPTETTYAKTDLPLVVLEGLAAGVPAIVGTGTPMDELVEAGAALGVVPGSSAALADEILGVLEDRERLDALGAAGRAHVALRHSAAGMAEAHGRIYRELLDRA